MENNEEWRDQFAQDKSENQESSYGHPRTPRPRIQRPVYGASADGERRPYRPTYNAAGRAVEPGEEDRPHRSFAPRDDHFGSRPQRPYQPRPYQQRGEGGYQRSEGGGYQQRGGFQRGGFQRSEGGGYWRIWTARRRRLSAPWRIPARRRRFPAWRRLPARRLSAEGRLSTRRLPERRCTTRF